MFTQLLCLIVIAYIVVKFLRSGTLPKLLELLNMTKSSVKQRGGRQTTHDLIDGLFNSSGAAKAWASDKVGGARQRIKTKASGLRADDYVYDAERGELVLFLSKESDLVIGRKPGGALYAYKVDLSGAETELTKKAFDRQVAYLQRKGKLSATQERALKDFIRTQRG